MWGGQVENLQNKYAADPEKKMPKALQDRPVIEVPLDGYFRAFLALNRKRQAGFGGGQALTATDILSYGYAHGFGEDIQFFFKLMDELDTVVLEKSEEKRKADKPSKPEAPPASSASRVRAR